MTHITFLLPYEELAETVRGVFADHPRAGEITYTLLPAKIGQTHPPSAFTGTDVVIARGFAAARLLATIPQLTVELQVTGYDVLIATKECLRLHQPKTVGLVGPYSMIYGTDAISRILPGVQIRSRTLENDLELAATLREMRDEGCDAVLGGWTVARTAPDVGLPCVLLQCGREAIKSAINEALRAVEVHRTERQRSSRIAAIMNYTMEGIIATDSDGTITMINQFARARCGDGESPVGRPVHAYFPDLVLPRDHGSAAPVLDEICMVGGRMLVTNVVPLTDQAPDAGYVITFQEGPQIQQMEDKIRKKLHSKGFTARYTFADILGTTRAVREAKTLAARFATSDSNILVVGETGSGKEFFAQSIHNAGRRASGPFVAVNCAALPEHLLESELFGYVEGAFTGAARGGKAGLFELAHNGTIFLDEIGDVQPSIQARLLRVLQEREIIRLGHDRITPIDVRVIAATNKDLYDQVREGRFRSDLLYRLEVLKLQLPPLRDRVEDIPIIAEHFFHEMRRRQNTRLERLDAAATTRLQQLPWPGNLRELRNFCERLAVLTNHPVAGLEDVLRALGTTSTRTDPPAVAPAAARAAREREWILELLAKHGNSRKAVAAAMDIDTSTLWRKMKRHGLHPSRAGRRTGAESG
ncbi:MAG: sigma 54-interacting transcriptional regulator [Planctomycetes bacterium]|nr:sigma 54-interacting transcriptional regulator [Planctomycetota bacterium]